MAFGQITATSAMGIRKKRGYVGDSLQNAQYSGSGIIAICLDTCEQWKNPGCLGYIGDYTTQLYGDYFKPL